MRDTKKCPKCDITKLTSEFGKNKSRLDGLQGYCIQCRLEYSRTKKYLMKRIFLGQKLSVKSGRVNSLDYTEEELIDFITSCRNFNMLYDNWVKSGYKKNLIPSIDRIDDYSPYSLDNIQLMTWDENNKKGHNNRKNGINNKISKSVLCTIGTIVLEYYSIREAARQNNTPYSTIYHRCNNPKNNIWNYA